MAFVHSLNILPDVFVSRDAIPNRSGEPEFTTICYCEGEGSNSVALQGQKFL